MRATGTSETRGGKDAGPIPLDRIALIVLAAGRSRRMGRIKALIELEGRTLIEHILAGPILGRFADVVVVLGHHAERLRPLVEATGRRWVVNGEPERGRTGSIQAALRTLGGRCAAAFIQPVDCPLVSDAVYRTLAASIGDHDAAVPSHEGRNGHPPLIRRTLFGDILGAPPDRPLRDLLHAPHVRRCTITVDDPGVTVNLNTPGDLAALATRAHRAAPAAERDRA